MKITKEIEEFISLTITEHMNRIIRGKHKKTLIFPVFSGDSVLYSDSCLVVVWVL